MFLACVHFCPRTVIVVLPKLQRFPCTRAQTARRRNLDAELPRRCSANNARYPGLQQQACVAAIYDIAQLMVTHFSDLQEDHLHVLLLPMLKMCYPRMPTLSDGAENEKSPSAQTVVWPFNKSAKLDCIKYFRAPTDHATMVAPVGTNPAAKKNKRPMGDAFACGDAVSHPANKRKAAAKAQLCLCCRN